MTDTTITADIAAGMESLMRRANRDAGASTLSPAELAAKEAREAELHAAMEESMRNASLMSRLNNSASRYWWVWGDLAARHHVDVLMKHGLGSERARAPYDGSDVLECIAPDGTSILDMFRAMGTAARARIRLRMAAAPMVDPVHPLMLIDPVTGEFGPVDDEQAA